MAPRFTPLARPLLAFMARDRSNTAVTAASLLTPISYNTDVFTDRPQFLSGNYGFEGYMGIPGMNGTDAQSQAIAAGNNVAWESLDPALNAGMRAYTSAISTTNALAVYGVPLLRADTMPLVFSHPVLPATLNNTDFDVSLSDGSRVTPQVAAFLPNLEYNERQTVVIARFLRQSPAAGSTRRAVPDVGARRRGQDAADAARHRGANPCRRPVGCERESLRGRQRPDPGGRQAEPLQRSG